MSSKIPRSQAQWTLRARLVASTIAAVAVALSVGFVWARRNLHQVLVEQIDETLVNKYQELTAVAATSFEALERELNREIEVYERVEMTVLIEIDGRKLIAPNDADGRRTATRLHERRTKERFQTLPAVEGSGSLRIFAAKLPMSSSDGGSIEIAVSLQRSMETLRLFDQRV